MHLNSKSSVRLMSEQLGGGEERRRRGREGGDMKRTSEPVRSRQDERMPELCFLSVDLPCLLSG